MRLQQRLYFRPQPRIIRQCTRQKLRPPLNRLGKRRLKDLEDATVAEIRAAPENHKLSTLSEFLSVELDHHNALSDAIACGEITVQAVDRLGQNTLASAYEHAGLDWGEMSLSRSPASA